MVRVNWDNRSILLRRLSRRRAAFVAVAGVVIAAIVAFFDAHSVATTDMLRIRPALQPEPRFVEAPIPLPGKTEIDPSYLNNRNQIQVDLIRGSRGEFIGGKNGKSRLRSGMASIFISGMRSASISKEIWGVRE